MRLPILALLAALALAGCSQGQDPTPVTDAGDPVDGVEADPARAPSDRAVTANCGFAYAGSRVGGTDLQLGSAEEECSVLLNTVDADEPLPFRVALVEMSWDAAQPTIDAVGFDFSFYHNLTEVGSVSQSTDPGGAAGTLVVEVPLAGSSPGSLDVVGSLVFEGATSRWEGTVVVSAFEVETVPGGYTAL